MKKPLGCLAVAALAGLAGAEAAFGGPKPGESSPNASPVKIGTPILRFTADSGTTPFSHEEMIEFIGSVVALGIERQERIEPEATDPWTQLRSLLPEHLPPTLVDEPMFTASIAVGKNADPSDLSVSYLPDGKCTIVIPLDGWVGSGLLPAEEFRALMNTLRQRESPSPLAEMDVEGIIRLAALNDQVSRMTLAAALAGDKPVSFEARFTFDVDSGEPNIDVEIGKANGLGDRIKGIVDKVKSTANCFWDATENFVRTQENVQVTITMPIGGGTPTIQVTMNPTGEGFGNYMNAMRACL